MTPFRETCNRLARVVRDHPGIKLKPAIEKLQGQWHYSSFATAIGSLRKWGEMGKVHGVDFRWEQEDGKGRHLWRLYPKALEPGQCPNCYSTNSELQDIPSHRKDLDPEVTQFRSCKNCYNRFTEKKALFEHGEPGGLDETED